MASETDSPAPVPPPTGVPTGIDLEALYVVEWGRLVRVAFLMTDSQASAEEIVQDAFVRLQSSSSTVRNPGGYLRTSVVNACRDLHRHRAVVARTPVDRVEPAWPEHDELSDALGALPWRQQAALVLRYHADLPEAEIARLLECRPSTVRSITRRALAALRKELS